jgi:hypothetical protein
VPQQRPPSTELLKFLAVYDPAVGQLALALRDLVLKEAPSANEIVYDAYNAVAIAFSFTDKWQEGFCHIAVYSRYANLGFQRGTELDDPQGVLKGTGKSLRHIRIASQEDLGKPYLRKYLRAAIKHTQARQLALKPNALLAKTVIHSGDHPKRRPR